MYDPAPEVEIAVDPYTGEEVFVLARPNPGPQTALVTCRIPEIFYGGARGGGKTYGLVLDWSSHERDYGQNAKGILFRRTYNELDEVVETARALLLPLGADWKAGSRTFVMPSGATLKLRHLLRHTDATLYQGHQYTWMGFDELPNWPDSRAIDELRATLRSAAGVETRLVATGNPGGRGHNWVKARYLDPAPPFVPYHDPATNTTRVFIPSRLSDNPPLVENDPTYVDRLKQSGPDWLVRAWLEGDWDIVAGGMFDDVWAHAGKTAVLRPFAIPASWRVDRSFDAGFAHPFSVGWHAESDGTEFIDSTGERRCLPRGSIVRVGEWYGYSGTPNEGLKLLPKQIAEGIKAREDALLQGILKNHSKIHPGPADTEIWNADKGVCVADELAKYPHNITFVPADKSPGTRVNGWQRLRGMLAATAAQPVEDPGYYVFDTCREWLRTVPSLPRDDKHIEDVDTTAEDHIGDETRYRCLYVRQQVTVGKLTGF